MSKPRPIIAYAVIKTAKPKLSTYEIYEAKDKKYLLLEKGEKIVKIIISIAK